MRHRKSGRQFSRNTSHRKAMFRALAANLVLHERIETTDAKAKELRRIAERLISRARRLGETAYTPWEQLDNSARSQRVAAKRLVSQYLRRFGVVDNGDGEESEKVDLVEKVFVDLAKRYKERPGGYTRIIKLGRRRGDNAPMCLIELVEAGKPAQRLAGNSDTAAAAEAAAADNEAVATSGDEAAEKDAKED